MIHLYCFSQDKLQVGCDRRNRLPWGIKWGGCKHLGGAVTGREDGQQGLQAQGGQAGEWLSGGGDRGQAT